LWQLAAVNEAGQRRKQAIDLLRLVFRDYHPCCAPSENHVRLFEDGKHSLGLLRNQLLLFDKPSGSSDSLWCE
jgi:hypothetical protein